MIQKLLKTLTTIILCASMTFTTIIPSQPESNIQPADCFFKEDIN